MDMDLDTSTAVWAIIGLILLIVALIAVGPLLTIWSLNTLFGLSIAYTFKTWIAALVLGLLVSNSTYIRSE